MVFKDNKMKSILMVMSAVGALSLFIITLCCTTTILRRDELDNQFKSIIERLNRYPDRLAMLKNKKIGFSGYFYIIDSTGRVVYHPKEALIGMSFFNNPFVKSILYKRAGCVKGASGGEARVMIFRPLGSDRILCLSLSINEVDLSEFVCDDYK